MTERTYIITSADLAAINKFTVLYPTWWYKIGVCSVSRDFDAAPQAHSPEIILIESGAWPDDCFSCDSRLSIADAIEDVIQQIQDAKVNNGYSVHDHFEFAIQQNAISVSADGTKSLDILKLIKARLHGFFKTKCQCLVCRLSRQPTPLVPPPAKK